MAHISREHIEAVALRLEQIQDDIVMESLIDQFGETQPTLLAYLMTIGEDDFNEDERELMLFVGLTIWQSMDESGEATLLTEESLEDVQGENLPILESLEGKGKGSFKANMEELLPSYSQPELLKYVIEMVTEEESYWVRPGNQYVMIIFLKIIIDCLDK